ncbi:MAG: RNA polymerase sigma factor [Candidatus Eisenbacteria bacterium]|nr:RNA polymerase sigma factor [Candidatus Eisenbacteria bacterium]
MEPRDWRRLIELLGPIHRQAALTARRLSRSVADGDDLLQEAVLRAYEKLPGLRDATRFRPWFYAILVTVHRNRARRDFWKRFVSLDGDGPGAGTDPAGENGVDREHRRAAARRVADALARLPAAQREAVVLFELEGFSIGEISEVQGASVAAVKSRLARGRERLRRHYERLGYRVRPGGIVLRPEGETS